jgi:hypothetical protein
MRRRSLAAPLALLPATALARDFTPSGALEMRAAVPVRERVSLPPSETAVARWQLPQGNVWGPYSKLTLLAWMGARPIEMDLPRVRVIQGFAKAQAAAAQLAAAGVPDDTLWILDLRGADSVAFVASLSHYADRPVAPVLTFNNWPAPVDKELIPAEETLAALLTVDPALPPTGQDGAPFFMLDAWRRAFAGDPVPPEKLDNRYLLGPSDFPDAETLRQRGITNVVYVVEDLDLSPEVEDDVNPVLLAYQQAGLSVSMADLDALSTPPTEVTDRGWDDFTWSWWRQTFAWAPRPRNPEALPALHASSPGGFGGHLATPIHLASFPSGTSHGGGG